MPTIVLAILLQIVADNSLREGLLAMNRGDLASARNSLETASRQEPANAIVWAALAQVYLKSNRKDAAMAAALRAEQLSPDNPAIQHALAMFYSGAGESGKAANYERKFAESAQADSDAYVRAADLYLQANDGARAVETAEAGISRQDRPALHHILGLASLQAKQSSRALEELRAAVRLAPTNEEFVFDLAQVLFRMERFAEAAGALEIAARANPSGPQTQLALGVAYYSLRRFPEAVEAFLNTIDLSPDVEQPYLFLTKVLDQAGTSAPRIATRFEEFRRKHPDSYLGSFLMAKLQLFQGVAPERIQPLLEETIAKNDRLWEPHSDLADVLSRKREFALAALELERAATLNPSEPSVPFRLARIYDRLNRPERAAEQRARHKALLAQPKSGMGGEQP